MIVIAEILPLDTVAGARKLVRLTTDNTVDGTGVNEKIWTPAITEPPVIGIRLFKGDFDNTASASGGSIKIALDRLQIDEPYARRYLWAGAPIKLWAGVSGQAWPWQQVFEGQINSFSAEGSILDLKTKVNEEPFQANVLINKYAGTGGIEGGIDLKDKPKPMLLGRCFNAQPVQINSVYHVYQFHGYGPIQGISGLFERGSNFGAVFGDYTDYASLVAAPIPNGSWATCLAQGLIRLGAPAYGVITADVDGDKGSGIFRRKPGQIVLRLCEIAAVANTAIEISSFAALDLRLAALPNQGRIGHYQTDQTDILSLSASICSDVVHVCGVSLLGKLFASPLTISPPNIRLDAQARELPKVYSSVEKQVSPPYSLIEMGYARSWKVHSADEIAFIEPAQPGATNDANLSDPTQLTINEKIRLITTEATRANRRLAVRARMLALALSVAALDQALVDWFVVRNGVSPAWDNISAHSTINRATWNAVSLAYDAALDASDIAISQEDARRASVDGNGNLVGDGTSVANSFVPPGQNLIANSDQTTMTFVGHYNSGITVGFGPILSKSIFGTDNYALSGSINNVVLFQNGMQPGGDSGGLYDFTVSQPITVAPGEKFIYSAYCASHRCKHGIYIFWYNALGIEISYSESGPTGLPTDNLANILAAPFYNRIHIMATAPAGTASAKCFIRKYNTLSVPDSYIWLAAPMLERAAPNQTTPSPYQPGAPSSVRQIGYNGDLDADVTAKTQLAITGVDDITINFDHANNALTSLPKIQGYKVTRGGIDVTATAALTVTVKSGTIAASIAADGMLSLDKLGGVLTSAVLELGGTYGAAALPTKTVRITREKAAAPTAPPSTGVGSPTGDSTPFNGTSGSATPTAVSRELVVVVGSAGTVTLNGNYEFSVNTPPSSTQNYGLATRWYKWNGSAFIAIGAAIPAYTNYNAAQFETGTGECGFTDTGNAAASTQKYKLFAININPSANSGTRTISGDVYATGVNP